MGRMKQLEFTVDLIYDLTNCDNLTIVNTITDDEKHTIDTLDEDLQEKISGTIENIKELINGDR